MAVQGLKKHQESKTTGYSKFYKLKPDESVKVQFLQELDEDAKNFIAEVPLATFNTEWQNPDDFTKEISDTMDSEQRCVGRELSRQKTGRVISEGKKAGEDETGWDIGWRPKEFMYINGVVDNGKEEPFVTVFKFNMAPKATEANVLIDGHNLNGSITDRVYTYSRTGKGRTDTTYKLVAHDKDAKLPSPKTFELQDIDSLLPNVPYAKQREALGVDDVPRELVGAGAQTDSAGEPSGVKW